MNGAGNDFILIDNRDQSIQLIRDQIVRLCHRQRGVGADGVLLLVPSRAGQADWAWDFYNSDGSSADMCGNGARCFARFIQRITGSAAPTSFETGAGVIRARFSGNRVTVTLTPPKDLRLDNQLAVDNASFTVHSLNTGVPHAVVFVPNADRAMVADIGAKLRHHPHFKPHGSNVNFVQLLGPNSVRVRTYERGVEGETLACGTGVTASALVAARLNRFASPVKVQVQGGEELEVGFDQEGDSFSNVQLTGPAEFVFDGRIHVESGK